MDGFRPGEPVGRRARGRWRRLAVGVAVVVGFACSNDDADDTTPVSSAAETTGATPDTTTTAEVASAFPPQPDGVPFPTQAWPEARWPDGIDRVPVDAAVDDAFGDGGEKRVRAVVVVHHGAIVYERYSANPRDGAQISMPGYSMAKSFTSALVGILVGDGRLDVKAPAPVPEWQAASDPRGDISLEHLLQMASGLEWDEGRFPAAGDLTSMVSRDDIGAYVASKDLSDDPGSTFEYNTGGTMLVARVLADEVGSGDEFRAFMQSRLLDKIGISDLGTRFDDTGTWLGGVYADTTARGFAKFGLLFLRDGVWDGERILPEGWVEYSRTASPANPEYGAGWWLDLARPGVFYAVGIRGQAITVDPEHDLVIAQLATDGAVSLPVTEAILDTFAAA